MNFRTSTNENIKHAGKKVCYSFTASCEKTPENDIHGAII